MKAEINTRGNGACPLCVNHGACHIQKSLDATIKALPPNEDTAGVELVVYSCPKFREKI